MAGAAITGKPIPTGRGARRRLIINADDLGLSDGVNRGIIESVEYGVVTSASMIVNMPGWDDAVERLNTTRASLGIGLHFNIVTGRPLTSGRTITDPNTGAFYSLRQLTLRALAGRIDRADVSIEFAAQLGKLRTTGVQVTHVDSHRHTHALRGIGPAILDAAGASGVPAMRIPLEPIGVNAYHWQATLKKVALGASWRTTFRKYNLPERPHAARYAEHFFGVSLQGGTRFAERISSIIDHLPAGTSEVMVHPGYSDDVLASMDHYTWQRECEVRALVSPALRTRLEQRNIELVNFGSLDV